MSRDYIFSLLFHHHSISTTLHPPTHTHARTHARMLLSFFLLSSKAVVLVDPYQRYSKINLVLEIETVCMRGQNREVW